MSTKGAYNLQNKEIMKRKQIIKIMQKGFEEMACREASKSELNYFKESADAILSIPLEVPNDEEIEETLWEEINIPLSEKDRENNTVAYKQYKETFLWMRWMRNEIIKRNN